MTERYAKFKWRKSPFGAYTEITSTTQDGSDPYVAAYEFALQCGYTPPRWWQWWRWFENRPPIQCKIHGDGQ